MRPLPWIDHPIPTGAYSSFYSWNFCHTPYHPCFQDLNNNFPIVVVVVATAAVAAAVAAAAVAAAAVAAAVAAVVVVAAAAAVAAAAVGALDEILADATEPEMVAQAVYLSVIGPTAWEDFEFLQE